jgi:tRNA modification GTPase
VQERLLECEEAILMGMTLDAVAVSLDGALEALMELSGERVTEQVADGVFHQFCVGK